MRKLYPTVLALSLIVTISSCTSKPENVSGSNTDSTKSTQINESSKKELTSSDLESKISDLQSQIDEIKGNTSSIESSIPEIDIDLKVLADKIIAECPPPDGVELVIDTENKDSVFNLNQNYLEQIPKGKIDTNDISDFIRIYNPNPTKPEEMYHIVIAKIDNEDTLKYAPYNLYESLSKILKQMTSDFLYASEEIPNKPIKNYIYDVMISDDSSLAKKLIEDTINN